MPIVKQSSKKLEKKNYKVLKQAIEKNIEWFSDFYIENNILYIKLSNKNVCDESGLVQLYSYREIKNTATQIYKKFNFDNISKIRYFFENEKINKKLKIEANFIDIKFDGCTFYDLNISSAGSTKIKSTKFVSGSIITIACRNLELEDVNLKDCDNIKILSDNTKINYSILKTVGNIDIVSPVIVFNNTKLQGLNINLKCNLIGNNDTVFKADYDFKINCRDNEIINGIDAKSIVYNKKDITNSDSILRQKLFKKLINDLKKVKEIVTDDIKKDIEETTRIRRETLEGSSIAKILNKNNR